jgi:hypothetical protein
MGIEWGAWPSVERRLARLDFFGSAVTDAASFLSNPQAPARETRPLLEKL